MTFLLYLLQTAGFTGQTYLGKRMHSNGISTRSFHINGAFTSIIIFFLCGLWNGCTLHKDTVTLSILYGILMFLFLFTGYKALENGSAVLTCLITSFSFIFPFIAAVTIWKEGLSMLRILGILLVIAVLIMLCYKKGQDFSTKWIIYTVLSTIFAGTCAIIQKHHQVTYPGEFHIEFMFISSIILLFLLILAHKSTPLAERSIFKFSRIGLLTGVLGTITMYVILYLSSTVNASALYPSVSVLNTISTFAIGKILSKEKPNSLQIGAMAAGIVAVIILNL